MQTGRDELTESASGILLVEDNPGDVRLTLEAFKTVGIDRKVHVVRDGSEALEFLEQELAERLGLILLDLNLPKMDGRAVLQAIKSSERLKQIPVVVWTTSKSEQDIEQSYSLRANGYVTKPLQFEDIVSALRGIERFWLRPS